jgi:hypothetical protein
MMKQKEAVYQAITNIFELSGEGAVELDRGQKHEVIEILTEGFKAGKISYDGAIPADKELRNYCSGLLNNWLRKDTRLNGGVKYEPKNPGSRAGSGDPTIKALRQLMASGMLTSPEDIAEVQSAIDRCQAELKPVEKPAIDVSALPEALRSKFFNH